MQANLITNACQVASFWVVGRYVIMPNHVHALIAFRNHRLSINKRVGEGKRFITYGIVDRLAALGKADVFTTGMDGGGGPSL